MTSLPTGSVFPFESQPNRLWWHLCVLHESTTFHQEKICTLCSSSYDMKRENTETWSHSSCHKRSACLCGILLNYVAWSTLKAMSDTRSYKSSQQKHRTQIKKIKCTVPYGIIYLNPAIQTVIIRQVPNQSEHIQCFNEPSCCRPGHFSE